MATPRQKKQWRIARQQGRPARMKGAEVEQLRARLRGFHSRGMSWRTMSEQVGVAQSTISVLVNKGSGITRRNYNLLVRVYFEESDKSGARVSPIGVERRIQALWAAGYPIAFLDAQYGISEAQMLRALRGQLIRTHAEFAGRIAAVYDKLSLADPLEMGVGKQGHTLATNQARRRGLAGPGCWDPDTIDDPSAKPEWTGACGTPEGLRIHYRDEILPACRACLDTRTTDDPHPGSATSDFRGAKLTAVRERRGLSIKGLAELLAVDKGTVYYWETGRSSPRSRHRLQQLCRVLGCMESDLTEEA